jgi:hypothetical protein
MLQGVPLSSFVFDALRRAALFERAVEDSNTPTCSGKEKQ